MDWLLKILAGRLDNYKTYIIGGCFILSGVATAIPGAIGIVGTMWGDSGLEPMEFDAAKESFKAGIELMGVGAAIMSGRHAVAKLKK